MSTALNKYRSPTDRQGDTTIILIAVGLALLGLLLVSSASVVVSYDQFGKSSFYWNRQAVYVLVAVLGMIVTSTLDYHFWRKHAVNLMIFTLIALVVVLTPIGLSLGGAHRWINFGPFLFQPSELAKLALIVYLSAWFETRRSGLESVGSGEKKMLPFVSIVVLLGALIIAQPDMGTMGIIIAISGVIWFLAGAKTWQIVGAIIAIVLAFFILVKLSPYRAKRLETFLNPSADVLGSGYQINQAMLAIGNGGLWGLGFGQSRQKYLYLPQPHTDAIFAIVIEELGFIRVALILLVFSTLIYRGYQVSKHAPDSFGSFLAAGVTSWIAIQVVVNVSAISGMFPLTGVPLPFLSFGGSSLLFIMMGIGIVYNISRHTR